jgi:hypothetical protein
MTMADRCSKKSQQTAVDDVRRVRERIAKKYGGNLAKHIAETNRIGEKLRAKLNVRLVPDAARLRDGTRG